MYVCCELCMIFVVCFWHERRISFEFQACRGSIGPFTICVRISSLPVIIPPVGLYPCKTIWDCQENWHLKKGAIIDDAKRCKMIKDYIIFRMFFWSTNHFYFDRTSNHVYLQDTSSPLSYVSFPLVWIISCSYFGRSLSVSSCLFQIPFRSNTLFTERFLWQWTFQTPTLKHRLTNC